MMGFSLNFIQMYMENGIVFFPPPPTFFFFYIRKEPTKAKIPEAFFDLPQVAQRLAATSLYLVLLLCLEHVH